MSSNSGSLGDLHHRLGATLASYRGASAPADYGDAVVERDALRQACGLVDRSWASGLEILGEDRDRFLGGYVTCEVKDLAPGDGVYGFLTSVKGRVLADAVILAVGDRLWLELPPGRAEEISDHLTKYVIADRVEIRPLDLVSLSLIGPRAGEVLGGDPLGAVWSHRPAGDLAAGARLIREPAFEVGGHEIPARAIRMPAAGARACFERLLEAGGVVPVGHRAYDALRVAAGRPLFGLDFDDDNFPQETGLEEQTVSYTKGCYLGQEVVARIHYRGGVNRRLRGLIFDDDAADPAGRAVMAGGREVGTVTSVATAGARRLGLAILHERAAPGSQVEISGGGTARVVELPFPAES